MVTQKKLACDIFFSILLSNNIEQPHYFKTDVVKWP